MTTNPNKCPECKGEGRWFHPATNADGDGVETCSSCAGTGVIPPADPLVLAEFGTTNATNQYIEAAEAAAAEGGRTAFWAAFWSYRNSFTSAGWERHQLQARQALIDNGATVRADGRLEIQVRITL